MTVVDRDTQKPLPYRYGALFIDPAKTAKREHQDAWINLTGYTNTEDMRAFVAGTLYRCDRRQRPYT